MLRKWTQNYDNFSVEQARINVEKQRKYKRSIFGEFLSHDSPHNIIAVFIASFFDHDRLFGGAIISDSIRSIC